MRIEKFLKESPLFAVNKVSRTVEMKMQRILKEENLNLLQGLVLVSIFFENAGAVTPSELAKSFCTTRGNMSHCISFLEYEGLVKRQISAVDARRLEVFLKPEGKKKAQRLIKLFDRFQDQFEKQMGQSELKDTLSNLCKIEDICLIL